MVLSYHFPLAHADTATDGAGCVAGQINCITAGTPSTAAINNGNSVAAGSGSNASAADQAAVQSCSAVKFNTVIDIAIWIKCLIGAVVIPGIFSLAFLVFLWGVFKFIRSSDKTDKEDSKQFIFAGLIGLFVMVSVWGIIKILSTTLGIQSTVPMLQTDYLTPSKTPVN